MQFIFIRLSGCNDNPTAQQFTGAYRKLLVQNEVVSGRGANCINDITKILTVPSKKRGSRLTTNSVELNMLADIDFENQTDDVQYVDTQLVDSNIKNLKEHSVAYIASCVEENVLRKLSQKGQNACLACIQVFVENVITDDSFIKFKSGTNNILPPCKSTIELIHTVEKEFKRYDSYNVSFSSMLTHILRKIDLDQFYDASLFDEEHDHKNELIRVIVHTYMNIRSTQVCKLITRMSQEKQIRHSLLKTIHFEGQ